MCSLSIISIGSSESKSSFLWILWTCCFSVTSQGTKLFSLKKNKSFFRIGITKTTSILFVFLHYDSKGQEWLSWLVCLLRRSEKHILLLASWYNRSSKLSLKRKPIPLLMKSPQRNKTNIHNASTVVLCFELYCGILPFLEHFSCKDTFMFLQAFNLRKK